MYVDSFLEIYTTLFGWLFYNNLWNVLKDSGLLLLPFIGMVLDHMVEYKRGVEAGDSEELAQKGLAVDLLMALGVIMLCGVPFMNFQATELVFIPPAMNSSAEESSYDINSANSTSTYGQGQAFGNYPLDVRVPVVWWAVHNISTGLTHSVMAGLPSTLDLRRYTEMLKEVSIKDPELQKELGDFKRDCYTKALSKYNEEKPNKTGPYVDQIETIFDEEGIEDPYWMGSHVFLTIPGYYNSLRSETVIDGFPFNPVRDVEWDPLDPNLPENGRPWCDHWWADSNIGLRDRVIDQISFIENLSATVESALNFSTRQDLLVKVALYQSPITYAPRGYDFAYANTGYGNDGFLGGAQNVAKQTVSSLASFYERVGNSVNVTMTLNAAPIFQALLMMVTIIFIPFVLFLSRYSLSSVLAIAWALFSFRFLTACWMFAWWIDQNTIAALYPDTGSLTKIPVVVNIDVNTNEMLLYLLNSLYIAIPILFTVISGWAGYNVIRGMSSGTLMGGMSSAGQKMANKGMNAAKNAAIKK
ncbi:conjugal transfer protein TraG N-terminal domain-containing protein [Aliikangiella maris]|uniref:Conjugal transfer protein TraG N-terminal domain-containing protein n=2 Tax=Aliikangiella maris TaxID=3162458 RepID=A0ABV2BYF0_9GAMM